MNYKKMLSLGLAAVLSAGVMSGCGEKKAEFNTSENITVVSREDGSGTRGAFIELFKIQEKDSSGKKVDNTTTEAIVVNKTDVMLQNVSGDEYSIGYVSLGSLSGDVKALKIDGNDATAENVKSGTYKVSRPFNIATKGDTSDVTKDFISFILSKEGQEVVSKSYISVSDSFPSYSGTKPAGKIVIAGSTSVSPIMEKLKEEYLKINTNAQIEIQTNDSTAGMTSAAEGTCDIGMASRALSDKEKETLTDTQIALDGIAVIVNNKNTLDNMSSETVKAIFTGKTTTWSEIIK